MADIGMNALEQYLHVQNLEHMLVMELIMIVTVVLIQYLVQEPVMHSLQAALTLFMR